MQSYFGTLDDELVIRILGHLGSTVCLGAAPEPRAALLPIQPHPNHSNICNEAPLVAPELSIEFQKAPVAESSSVLLHTPQLQTHVATGLPHSCSGHASGSSSRRSVPIAVFCPDSLHWSVGARAVVSSSQETTTRLKLSCSKHRLYLEYPFVAWCSCQCTPIDCQFVPFLDTVSFFRSTCVARPGHNPVFPSC